MNQPTFWDTPERFAAWKEFHRRNPVVFELFYRFAVEAKRSGRTRLGARMIGERIRWYTTIETTDAEFKINDHHWPYYARLLAGIDSRFTEEFFVFKDSRFDASIEEIVEYHSSLNS